MMRVLVIFRELAVFPTMPNLVSVENDATLAKSGTWKKISISNLVAQNLL